MPKRMPKNRKVLDPVEHSNRNSYADLYSRIFRVGVVTFCFGGLTYLVDGVVLKFILGMKPIVDAKPGVGTHNGGMHGFDLTRVATAANEKKKARKAIDILRALYAPFLATRLLKSDQCAAFRCAIVSTRDRFRAAQLT